MWHCGVTGKTEGGACLHETEKMESEMRKNARPFDAAAKVRVMRAETARHGQIRPGSFARNVHSKVDKQAPPPVTPLGAPVKKGG